MSAPTKAELDDAWISACKAWSQAHKAGWTAATKEKYQSALANYRKLEDESEEKLPIDKPPSEE